jgi:hypothetical protein
MMLVVRAQRGAVMPKPVITAQSIMTSLRHVIDPTDKRTILWDAPVGRYIRGGKAAVRAFHNVLNKSPQFRGYKLSLTPGDMNDVGTVADIGIVVIDWFKGHGYRVIV